MLSVIKVKKKKNTSNSALKCIFPLFQREKGTSIYSLTFFSPFPSFVTLLDLGQSQDPIIVENAKKNEMLHQLQISRPLSLYLSTVLKNGPDSIGLFPDIVSEVSDSDYINYYWDLMAINPSQSQYKIFNRYVNEINSLMD